MGVTDPEAGKKIVWFLAAQAAWTAAVIALFDGVQYVSNGFDASAEFNNSVAAGELVAGTDKYKEVKAEIWDFDLNELHFNNYQSGSQWFQAVLGGIAARGGAFALRGVRMG